MKRSHFDNRGRVTHWIAISSLLWIAIPSPSAAQTPDFDHFRTRFPLVGAHNRVDCESCHRDGLFRGTPSECRQCHDGTGQRATTAASSQHIPHAGLDCDSCHRTRRWDSARMDHSQISNRCGECHNGMFAEGRHTRHIRTTDDCGECHRTTTWSHARMDHDAITGSCTSCHDGVTATGKNAGHFVTTQDCGICHSTRRWSPSRFDHSEVSAPCSTCHDGITATGKHGGHIVTSSECDVCHSTRRWSPTDFDHSGASGTCSTCHNGTDATGIPSGHFTTALECDSCHSTSRWSSMNYGHAGTAYPGDHRQTLDCTDCHGGNSQAVTWPAPSYQPDCAACHYGDFERDEHKKHENPDRDYTTSELRDCSGSCHVYEDSSLTTIKERRTREHRVSDRDFD